MGIPVPHPIHSVSENILKYFCWNQEGDGKWVSQRSLSGAFFHFIDNMLNVIELLETRLLQINTYAIFGNKE